MEKIRVYFALYGDEFPVEEFTKDIGILPNHTTKKGKSVLPDKELPIAQDTSWAYGTEELTVTEYPEIQLNWLIDQLVEKTEIINIYKEKYDLRCKLVAVIEYTSEHNRGFTLNERFMSFVNAIGARFETDIYID
ncbi:DUF4279 domain-containing protein [Lysinibacillus sp. LZ02]|uniref:DUF4279 domain-containing protein n=1 Tax=Lysinibacillus sp. LZ02 TaxID=3420668 RepID=UPI003D35A318